MWFILLLAVVVATISWILAPLFGVRRSWAPFEHATVEEQLLAERERLLRSLKDLEQEHEAGIIGEEEYADLRTDYLAEAAAVYRRLEELGAQIEGEGA